MFEFEQDTFRKNIDIMRAVVRRYNELNKKDNFPIENFEEALNIISKEFIVANRLISDKELSSACNYMQENSQNDVNGCVYILINVIRILNIVSSDKHEYYDNDKRDIVLTIKKSFYDFIESVSDKVSDIYNFSKEDLVICLLSLSSQAEYAVENANEAIKNAIEAKNEVLNIADKASQSGLAREFRKCTEELQQGKRGWLIAVTISIVCMFGVLIWSFVNIPSPISSEELTKEFLHRLPFLIPCFFALWISSRRYHDTVRLIEDYRFKSGLCATYSGFLDACRRVDGGTEMGTTGEGGQSAVQPRRSYEAEMELTRTVLRVLSTDSTRHLRKDKQDSGPILGLAEHCVDAIAGVVKRDRKGD